MIVAAIAASIISRGDSCSLAGFLFSVGKFIKHYGLGEKEFGLVFAAAFLALHAETHGAAIHERLVDGMVAAELGGFGFQHFVEIHAADLLSRHLATGTFNPVAIGDRKMNSPPANIKNEGSKRIG